jgi:hypothetical protein
MECCKAFANMNFAAVRKALTSKSHGTVNKPSCRASDWVIWSDEYGYGNAATIKASGFEAGFASSVPFAVSSDC